MNLAKVSYQLQSRDKGREFDKLFRSTKARMDQLQADIAKVIRECSQEAR